MAASTGAAKPLQLPTSNAAGASVGDGHHFARAWRLSGNSRYLDGRMLESELVLSQPGEWAATASAVRSLDAAAPCPQARQLCGLRLFGPERSSWPHICSGRATEATPKPGQQPLDFEAAFIGGSWLAASASPHAAAIGLRPAVVL